MCQDLLNVGACSLSERWELFRLSRQNLLTISLTHIEWLLVWELID